jgi:hypothetical protein
MRIDPALAAAKIRVGRPARAVLLKGYLAEVLSPVSSAL